MTELGGFFGIDAHYVIMQHSGEDLCRASDLSGVRLLRRGFPPARVG